MTRASVAEKIPAAAGNDLDESVGGGEPFLSQLAEGFLFYGHGYVLAGACPGGGVEGISYS